MKLWVDDIRMPPDSTWHTVRNVTEAIRAIHKFNWDIISLDHDISHYTNLDERNVDQEVGLCEETFQAVAYYIAAKYWHDKPLVGGVNIARANKYPEIIIHTGNPRGAKEIHDILKDVGIKSTIKPHSINT